MPTRRHILDRIRDVPGPILAEVEAAGPEALVMPAYSVFHAPVICPSCGQEIGYRAGETTFSWGRSKAHYFHQGDEIEWLRDELAEVVPPFTWYRKRGWFGHHDPEFNFGSPSYPDLIAFDPEISQQPAESRTCPSCQALYDHIGVMIRDGRLSGVKVFAEGELAKAIRPLVPFAETVLIRADGTYEPRPEWNDPPMRELER
jgi:hypothetical protein